MIEAGCLQLVTDIRCENRKFRVEEENKLNTNVFDALTMLL